MAARTLNGTIIRRGELFSLWRNLGRTTRGRGFVAGRALREGCVIPNTGGGLCQLSNALYDVTLRSGCEIVERHAHTRALPGSTTAPGRDATIFWNYVDFRFRPPVDCQLRVALSRGELTVAVDGLDGTALAPPVQAILAPCETRLEVAESCESCGVTQCFRNPAATSLARRGITAFLLDKFEPEFDRWITANQDARDILFVPLKSDRRPVYAWTRNQFADVHQALFTTLRRSWRSRSLAAQGAERQRALLDFDAALAFDFSKRIPHLADHLVISQNLLPHLWRNGDLGGRTFDVLMTRMPMAELEKILDAAAKKFPQSRTLADFRAPAKIREAEDEALAAARYWITPHSAIARMAGDRARKLDWCQASVPAARPRGQAVIFPASTLARKGCYEIRELARRCRLRLKLIGPIIEAPDFWRGIDAQPAAADWLAQAGVVVLPAWVEHWPRRLLQASAAGVPVVASTSCGLEGVANVAEVAPGDPDALFAAVERALVHS